MALPTDPRLREWRNRCPTWDALDEYVYGWAQRGLQMAAATYSHVDGRDLLHELQPNSWHFANIRVRIGGQWREYEGDWLKKLTWARDGHRHAKRAAIERERSGKEVLDFSKGENAGE